MGVGRAGAAYLRCLCVSGAATMLVRTQSATLSEREEGESGMHGRSALQLGCMVLLRPPERSYDCVHCLGGLSGKSGSG